MNDIPEVEVAKMAKNILKKAYPTVKFSVRTSKYSMGSSITVYWTDGPKSEDVDNLIGHLHGASFDGMTDMKEYNGRPYANDYIFTQRNISISKAGDILRRFDLTKGLPSDLWSLIEAGRDSLLGFYSTAKSWWMDNGIGYIQLEKPDMYTVSRLTEAYNALGYTCAFDPNSLTISVRK